MLNTVCFFRLDVVCFVGEWSRCSGYCDFYMTCDVSVKCAASCKRSAVSCIVCSFVIFVVDAIRDHIVEAYAYSSIGLVTAL